MNYTILATHEPTDSKNDHLVSGLSCLQSIKERTRKLLGDFEAKLGLTKRLNLTVGPTTIASYPLGNQNLREGAGWRVLRLVDLSKVCFDPRDHPPRHPLRRLRLGNRRDPQR